jgi:hypothetical protein
LGEAPRHQGDQGEQQYRGAQSMGGDVHWDHSSWTLDGRGAWSEGFAARGLVGWE